MTKKKILIGIAVLIIIALGAVALEKYRAQKIAQERERLIAQCRQEVSGMNEERLIGKINTLPSGTTEELEKLRNINALMYKHLRCKFFENPFEEQFEQTKSLVQAMNIPDEKKAQMIYDFSKYLKSAQENRDATIQRISGPTFPLVIYSKERVCPDGKENSLIVEKLINNAAKSGYPKTLMEKIKMTLANYCMDINKYSQEESLLTAEVYDFKDWPEDPWERKFEYRWKSILASRFGGKEKALGVCDNLSVASEKKDCQNRINEINGWPIGQIKAEGCTGYELSEVKDLICQSQQ
jgi:hypothetical protein